MLAALLPLLFVSAAALALAIRALPSLPDADEAVRRWKEGSSP